MFNFNTLQHEQAEWSRRNFGTDRDPSHALMGIMEELGELGDALNMAYFRKMDTPIGPDRRFDQILEDVKDSIADLVIFSADYCTLKGWDMAKLYSQMPYVNRPHNLGVRYRDLAAACGRLAHHHLKLVQAIRGTPEEHEQRGKAAMAEALFSARRLCVILSLDFNETVSSVWESVKKRDWKKDAVTACGHA